MELERFINRMADLITKYADAVNWDELPDPDIEAEDIKFSAILMLFLRSFSRFLDIKLYTEGNNGVIILLNNGLDK